MGFTHLRDGFTAFLLSWAIGLVVFPFFINWQRRRSLGQKIKKEGPNLHLHKENTPSIGGMVIVFSIVLTALFRKEWMGAWVFPAIVVVSFTAIGFLDDYFKSFLEKPWGIKARFKFLAQVVFSGMVMGWMVQNLSPEISLPFTQITLTLSRPLFFLFGVFVLLASTNAFNISDGLDGLAGGCGIISFLFWGWFFFLTGNPGMTALNLSIAGALFAFLWFNAWPAKIFMGDSGSLGLGALLGFMALASGQTLLLLFCGFVFVLETLSVIIQVTSFKIFGKRVFLMSPLHHHYELRGWKEHQITLRFWMVQALGAVIAVLGIRG
ncbi:MAG TPA: phospho-N-acetylmuramoyl-pentapeptide-transferase [Atribacteraceae bacterium]|nr:phospho-N-acetylmuramoyl-pentapeptide-transferase [Atribacteraceae bacterium]